MTLGTAIFPRARLTINLTIRNDFAKSLFQNSNFGDALLVPKMVPERRWRQAAAGAASVMLVAAAVSFSGGAARPGELVSIGVRLGAEQRMDLRQAVELGRSNPKP